MKRTVVKYLITTVAGLIIAFAYFIAVGLFGCKDAHIAFQILSNGFFIAGIMLLCVGALIWTSRDGLYDGMSYSLLVVFGRFAHIGDKSWHPDNYGDYVIKKREKRRDIATRHMFLVGAAYALLAGIMLLLYHFA